MVDSYPRRALSNITGKASGKAVIAIAAGGLLMLQPVASISRAALPYQCTHVGSAWTCVFPYQAPSGAEVSYTVPSDVTQLQVSVIGGSGGQDFTTSSTPGVGAQVLATLAVVPSQTLFVDVGGNGAASSSGVGPGGFNGGGSGSSSGGGGGGGGATGIYLGPGATHPLIVAGGGGGSGVFGAINGSGSGGNGGINQSGDGGAGQGCVNAHGGGGGTSVAGGAGGAGADGGDGGQPGQAGQGGNAADTNSAGLAGGGGGGFYGGGGGGDEKSGSGCGSGGGAGSSFAAANDATDPATAVVFCTAGVSSVSPACPGGSNTAEVVMSYTSSPTYAAYSHLHVSKKSGHYEIAWVSAGGVAGFNVYNGKTRLNHRMVVSSTRKYVFRTGRLVRHPRLEPVYRVR